MSEPTLAEIFRVHAENRERDIFTAFIGSVEKYTPGPPGPPVVDVLPVIKRALPLKDGTITHEDLPVVQNVPVLFPCIGNFSLTFPIAKGDHVLCLCTNWSHQKWRETGQVSEPGDLRTHELGNAIAIPGLHPKTATIPTAADQALVEVDGTTITHVQIGAGAAEFVVLADKLMAAFNAHTHAAGSLLDSMSGAVTGFTGAPPPADQYSVGGPPNDIAATKLKSE